MYAPPLVPKINLLLVLDATTLLNLLRYKRAVVKRMLFGRKAMGGYIICSTITLFYVIINAGMGIFTDFTDYNQFITTLYRWIVLLGSSIICSAYIIIYRSVNQLSLETVFDCLLYAGIGQAAIDRLMVMVPPIKNAILSLTYAMTGDPLIQNAWQVERRYNAFANNVLDTLGLCPAIVATLSFYRAAQTKRMKYFVFFIALLIPSLLNSRTGLVLSFVGAFLALPCLLSGKKLIKSVIYIALGIGALIVIWNALPVISPITAQWVESGTNSILELRGQGVSRSDSMEKLFSSRFWLLPNARYWIFGTGHNRYLVTGYPHTDVGYVNDFWFGGILGLALQYMPFVYLLTVSIKKSGSNKWNSLSWILFVLIAIFNVKGIVTTANGGMLLYVLILLLLLTNNFTAIRKKQQEILCQGEQKYGSFARRNHI